MLERKGGRRSVTALASSADGQVAGEGVRLEKDIMPSSLLTSTVIDTLICQKKKKKQVFAFPAKDGRDAM